MPNQNQLPTLPLHLMITMGYTLSWPFALQCANAGLLNLRKPLQDALEKQPLQKSLHEEAKNRSSNLLSAILKYSETPYTRDVPEPPCIWQKGSARLLDYGAPDATSVALFVPSLINRYYILDLEKERSMLRYLATQGIYPLVLDWGAPGENEKHYSIEDYVTEVLLPAIDFIYQTSGRKVSLVGYCMGGVLSLAAAQLHPKKIEKLALLATPWDFHCKAFRPFIVNETWQSFIAELIGKKGTVPADIIQSLFYLTDPFVFEHKYLRYASLDADSRQAKDFVALEHWVNDGVPMTSPAARDTMIGWAQQNQLAEGKWTIAGKRIDPKKIKQRVLMAIPKQDHVVPLNCAMPLAELIPNAEIIHPGAGHVGMIVGSKAKSECWQPLAEWINS